MQNDDSNQTLSAQTPPPVSAEAGSASGDFTPDQLRQMAKWSIDDKNLTLEQANEALAQDNVKQTIDENKLSQEAAEVDRDFPPAKPEHFQLPSLGSETDVSPSVRKEADSAIRGWLTGARFTKELGEFVVTEAERTNRQWNSLNDSQKDSYRNEQVKMLRKVYGSETDKKIALAQQLVEELESKRKGIKSLLDQTGASNNALVITKFILQAELLQKRKGS